jgi:eukaryotic-like serine/threonine-protein kinase
MPVEDLYILPDHVQLIPVKDIAEQTRSKFEYNEHDFVITNSNARNTSKIVDAASAGLLEEFKKPSSFIAVIFKYSYINKLNPQDTLEDAYTFLSRLRSEGFLVMYDATAQKVIGDLFSPGSFFKDYEVIEKIQGLSDTEVYKLKKDGLLFAMKILKPQDQSMSLPDQFDNEINVLEHVKGSNISPAIIESGKLDGNLYMILEYFHGTSCDKASEKYRNLNDHDNLLHLLTISVDILTAYEKLHKLSVIHSDIHPRNILVSENGTTQIIDFGLARFADSGKYNPRGGIGFFYEPEYASAILNGKPALPSSFAGEQYALAALIYFLITGKQYINFSFEKEVLLNQVINEPPVPFLQCDIDIDPEIEHALFKALSKNAANRYPSIGEFKTALSDIKNRLSNNSGIKIEVKYSFTEFCNRIKSRFGYCGNFIENGLQVSPTCSVNYGAAGIAYMFYRMSLIEKDPELLTLADVWANKAYDYINNKDTAFYATDIDITPATVGNISIYHNSTGVHLVQALINKAIGDQSSYYRCITNFIADASQPCEHIDITLGKSSVLIGCSLLHENIGNEHIALRHELEKFGNNIMNDIWVTIYAYESISSSNIINYKGIAHGWAGIIYASLRWCRQSGTALPSAFFQRVEQLFNTRIQEEDYTRWSISENNSSSWPGWCHGSAGYVFLWSELYKLTDNQNYLETAESTAKHFLAEENVTNGSLCCGLSGECYALLNLYNTTKNIFYLNEAKRLAKRILRNAYTLETKNNSLYKGDIGIAVLFTEISEPQYARMPLFE